MQHYAAALSAQINKSDRNDARGIAQMMRVGLYRPVHVKALASQKRRMLCLNDVGHDSDGPNAASSDAFRVGRPNGGDEDAR
jgi:hypothetical protein